MRTREFRLRTRRLARLRMNRRTPDRHISSVAATATTMMRTADMCSARAGQRIKPPHTHIRGAIIGSTSKRTGTKQDRIPHMALDRMARRPMHHRRR